MKSQGDSHQQQALFDEQPEFLESEAPQSAAESASSKKSDRRQVKSAKKTVEKHAKGAQEEPVIDATLAAQQFIDAEQEWQESPIDDQNQAPIEQDVTDVLRPAVKSRWWLKSVALLALLIATIEGVTLINSVWQQQSWLTGLYALLFVILFAGLLFLVFNEFRKLSQLARTEQKQSSTHEILQGEACDDIVRFCKALLPRRLDNELTEAHSQWQNLINDSQTDIDVLKLYDVTVVSVCDQKALEVVSKSSTQAAAVVALSPLAALDMFVIGWRNIRMIDDVAACYGVELGFISRLRLIKLVVYNLIYAGATELTIDIGLQSIGADLMGKVSARGAQGIGAGLLSARLGIKAIQLCRPLPFTYQENQPSVMDVMKRIKKVVLEQLKQVTSKIKKTEA